MGLGFLFVWGFLTALNPPQFSYYTYTKFVIVMRIYQKHYITLNKGTVKHTSNESSSGLIEL